MRTPRSATPPALALLAVGLLATLPGCVGYTTYPAASWQLASDNMNGPPADEIMIESIRWAVERYESGGEGSIAVNLPDAVKDRTYGIITYRAGERVVPVSEETAGLPTYHLTRLWVRGDKAEVDLLRPVSELGASPTGQPIIQAVTVYLKGGLREWRVERARHWRIGTDAVPQLHFFGSGDEPLPAPEGEGEDAPADDQPES
jgi:hypothetical protein